MPRLVDSKIVLTLEFSRAEHYKIAAALRDVCIHAKSESNDIFLKRNVKEGVEPLLYFLNISLPSRATAAGCIEKAKQERQK